MENEHPLSLSSISQTVILRERCENDRGDASYHPGTAYRYGRPSNSLQYYTVGGQRLWTVSLSKPLHHACHKQNTMRFVDITSLFM